MLCPLSRIWSRFTPGKPPSLIVFCSFVGHFLLFKVSIKPIYTVLSLLRGKRRILITDFPFPETLTQSQAVRAGSRNASNLGLHGFIRAAPTARAIGVKKSEISMRQ